MSLDIEVCEFPDMVDLNPVLRTTEFARIRQEPGDKLGSRCRRVIYILKDIHETEKGICRKSNSAKACHQWVFGIRPTIHVWKAS